MSAVNTVNTVDQTIATYANDNANVAKSNSFVDDYNNSVSSTLETLVAPRKSLADIAGLAVNDNQ